MYANMLVHDSNEEYIKYVSVMIMIYKFRYNITWLH